MGQEPPGTEPELFAEGVVSDRSTDEYGLVFTPDGLECFFTRLEGDTAFILMTRFQDGVWAAPEPAPFSGRYVDGHPFITSDGQKLYFGSRRPSANSRLAHNLWVVERDKGAWSGPELVDLGANDSIVHAASVAANGTIYSSGVLKFVLSDGRYREPQQLSPPINGSHPCIAPDESFLVFGKRASGQYNYDLFVSFRLEDGTWTEPENLGTAVNTDSAEGSPTLSPDGRYLFFSRSGDIWWVSAEIIHAARGRD